MEVQHLWKNGGSTGGLVVVWMSQHEGTLQACDVMTST